MYSWSFSLTAASFFSGRAYGFVVAARFTFHLEATDKVSELIAQVKAKGMGVGVALKPGTPVEVRPSSGPRPSPYTVNYTR